MYTYCQAYKMYDMRQFSGWTERRNGLDSRIANDDIVYLWSDFTVRQEPITGENIIFDSVTDQWIAFCSDYLHFQEEKGQNGIFNLKYSVRNAIRDDSDAALEVLPLTSGQWWYTEELLASHPRYFDDTITFLFKETPNFFLLEKAVHCLMEQHDALRLRIVQRRGALSQVVSEADELVPLSLVRLSGLSKDDQGKVIETTSYEMHKWINQLDGPLFHIVCFDFGPQNPAFMLWILSHLITDAFSQLILYRDLQNVYEQVSKEKEIQVPLKTTSFALWTQKIEEYLHSPDAEREFYNYWLTLPWDRVTVLPLDIPEGKLIDPLSRQCNYGTEASSRDVTVSLSTQATKDLLLHVLNINTKINHVLLSATIQAFRQWTGSSILYLFVVDNGRETIFENINLTHTVGYIAQAARVFLNIEGAYQQEEILQLVRSQLDSMPNQGRTLEWLLRKRDNPCVVEDLRKTPWAEINFNFLGRVGHQHSLDVLPFQKHVKLMQSDAQALRNHALNCNVVIYNKQLFMSWQYSESIHERATIVNLADNCIGYLHAMIECFKLKM